MTLVFTLAVLCGLSLLWMTLVGTRVHAAPFLAVCSIMLIPTLFGVFGLLSIGVWVTVLAAAAGILLTALSSDRKEILTDLASPAFVFFIVSVVGIYCVLAWRHPAFRGWDEFSFWGIAAKTIWSNRAFYTMVESSMLPSAYLPGLPLLGSFVQWFSGRFTEWQVYFGYDVLIFSVMTMLFSGKRWSNVISNLLCAVFGLFGLYWMSTVYGGTMLYATAYSDTQLGCMFGGVLLLWFTEKEKNLSVWTGVAAALAATVLVKDMGMALGLIACVVITADAVLSGEYCIFTDRADKKLAGFLFQLLLFVIPLLVYRGWLLHFDLVSGYRSVGDVPYTYSVLDMLLGRDAYFNGVLSEMISGLSLYQVAWGGPILWTCALLTLIPAGAALLCGFFRDGIRTVRLIGFAVMMLAGFGVFYLFHAYLYAAVFSHDFGLASLERYIGTYFVGWIIAAQGFASCAFGEKCRWEKGQYLYGALTMACALGVSFFYTPYGVGSGTLFDPETHVTRTPFRATVQERIAPFYDALEPGERIYLVCMDSDGSEWHQFNYEMVPAYTVDTYGLGNFVGSEAEKTGYYDVVCTPEDFINYLREQEVDYLYMMKTSFYFEEHFAPLFTDAMSLYYVDNCFLYRVVDTGADMYFEPCPNAAAVTAARGE